MKTDPGAIRARIISGVGGRYTVDVFNEDGTFSREDNLFAKGAFRHEKIKPLPGDCVTLRSDETGLFITGIEPRKNMLIRPAVANIDVLYITVSCRSPDPVAGLADKITVLCEKNSIRPVIVVTKSELDPDAADMISELYRKCGYDCFRVSSIEHTGIDALRGYSDEHGYAVSAFCGASGVGKSTLLNALFPDLNCETGDISEKIGRGKNTTRTVTLYSVGEGRYIADTPGFSLLDFERFDFCKKDELPYLFPEFRPYLCRCKYTKCSHTKEDGCLVRKAVADGAIEKSRYESYLSLYDDIKDKKDWQI